MSAYILSVCGAVVLSSLVTIILPVLSVLCNHILLSVLDIIFQCVKIDIGDRR